MHPLPNQLLSYTRQEYRSLRPMYRCKAMLVYSRVWTLYLERCCRVIVPGQSVQCRIWLVYGFRAYGKAFIQVIRQWKVAFGSCRKKRLPSPDVLLSY